MNMFVKRNDRVDVDVYVWKKPETEEIDATHDKSVIPEKVTDVETVTFSFRKPNYSDSTAIMQQAATSANNNDIDFAAFQDLVLRSLLMDWTIRDNDGDPVPVKPSTVNDLVPSIARAATAGCLEKVNLF